MRGIPLNTMFLLSVRHLWRSQGFPPTNHRKHNRNGTLARDVLRDQEEHRCASLLRPSPTLLHLLQEFHHLSSCFFRKFQGNFGMKAITLHSRLLPGNSLLPSLTPSLTTLAYHPPNSSTACPLGLARSCHMVRVLPTLSSSPHIQLTAWILLPPSESTLLLPSLLASWSCAATLPILQHLAIMRLTNF